jgi:hypothetical protein
MNPTPYLHVRFPGYSISLALHQPPYLTYTMPAYCILVDQPYTMPPYHTPCLHIIHHVCILYTMPPYYTPCLHIGKPTTILDIQDIVWCRVQEMCLHIGKPTTIVDIHISCTLHRTCILQTLASASPAASSAASARLRSSRVSACFRV